MPEATFVTRLQPLRLPARAARQLPDQSTTPRVQSSSTGNPRLRGALPKADSCTAAVAGREAGDGAQVYNATTGKPKIVSGSKEKPNETDRIFIGWSCNAGRGCRLHGARS